MISHPYKVSSSEAFKVFLSKAIAPAIMASLATIVYYLISYEHQAFSFISLIVSLSCFLLAIIIFSHSKRRMQTIWGFFNLAVFVWSIGCFFIGISGKNYSSAILSWKLFVLGITFIPVFFYHFVSEYCNLKKKSFLFFCYAQAIIFSLINLFSSLLVNKLNFLFSQFYYLQANFLYSFYFSIWILIVFFSFYNLYNYYKISTGLMRVQSAYIFYGMLLGFLGGATTAPQAWGFMIYPVGHFLTCVYAAVSTYAIFRYQLIDLKIAITRASVFLIVYSIVLGVPFAIALVLRQQLEVFLGDLWWIIPVSVAVILSTIAPFLYLYVQKKTEERLLADQKRYQSTLKQASAGMTRIKDLKKLLNMIVYILARTVNITHAALYLYNPKSRDYTLEAIRGDKLSEKNYYINRKSALIDYLEKAKLPIVAEEIKQQGQDYNREDLKEVYSQLKELGAEVVVPILTEKRLLAIGVLGKKKTGAMYAQDDLTVFSILASQVSLAIENAQFYEESKQTQEQLFQAEKMATIGTMADGLSHQINNRLHTLGFIAGDALDTIKLSKEVQNPGKFKEILEEISKALIKIQDNVKQGGEIVQGLLRYTRKGQEGFGEVVFDKLIDEVVEMAQFKIKKEYMLIVKDYPQDLPLIRGNFTQLQEVFFNIIDNAYDAIMQKKSELSDDHFMGKVKISTRQTEKFLEISLLDNGMGVKDEDQLKLFTPFFTTKFSNKKGTGLGLYVIKKIIEENHQGEVLISSEDKVGTLFVVKLPIFKKE